MTRDEIKAAAREMGYGFVSGVALYVVPGLLLMIAFSWAGDSLGWREADDTDLSTSVRSGVALRVDHGTGCQYLETSQGHIIPRVDASGKHMCGRRND